MPTYRPWLDETDHEEVFFASVHGYGRRREGIHFYPGSGPTGDNRNLDGRELLQTEEPTVWPEDGILEDFYSLAAAKDDSTAQGPLPWVVDVGMEGTGKKSERGAAWRRVWRGKTLPAIAAFKPDLIIISAGFDAHAKDEIQGPVNLGVKEADYEWLTEELCKIANTHCQGRHLCPRGRLPHPGRRRLRVRSQRCRASSRHVPREQGRLERGGEPEGAQPRAEAEAAAQGGAGGGAERRSRRRARWEEAAILAAQQATMEGGEEAAAAVAAAVMNEGTPVSKRRRKEVDYSALNAQLERENGAARPS